MFCENCGSKMAEGERFCSNCGSPVAPAPQDGGIPAASPAPVMSGAPYTAPVQPEYAPHFDAPPQKEPKRPANKKLIISAVIAVVLIASFVVVAFTTGLFSSKPKNDISSLERASINEMRSTYGEILNLASQKDSAVSIKLEPGLALKTLLSSQGVDLSWLNNVQLNLAADFDGGVMGLRARVIVNGTDLGALEFFVDSESGKGLIGIDGVSDSYAEFDPSSMAGMTGDGSLSYLGGLNSLTLDMDDVEDTDVIDLFEKYFGIIFDSIDEIEKSEGTFTANGVSQDCTLLTANLSQRQLAEIAKKVLTAAKDDGDLKNLFAKMYLSMGTSMYMYGADFDTAYANMQLMMQQMIDEFTANEGSYTDETALTYVDYVVDDKIIGRYVTYSAAGSQSFELIFGDAQSNGKFGTELTFNGVTYLLGEGTVSGTKLNGSLELLDGAKALGTLKLNDFDYQEQKGTMEISLSSDTWKMITGTANAGMLSSLTLRIEFLGNETKLDAVIGGMSALQATLSEGEKESVTIDSGKSRVDVNSWSQTLDLSALLSRLESAGIPKELLSGLLSQAR